MTQPEALRLADRLYCAEISYTGMCKAADELRRLHEVNAELLAALKMAGDQAYWPDIQQRIRVAITKAEGEAK